MVYISFPLLCCALERCCNKLDNESRKRKLGLFLAKECLPHLSPVEGNITLELIEGFAGRKDCITILLQRQSYND